MLKDPADILNFWFYEIGQARWFSEDPALDNIVRERFASTYERAALEELKEWEETPEGVLALLLLLDIFPRLMFRGTRQAYATDELALDLARRSIIRHFDDRIDKTFKFFFYLPFMHSERMSDQRLALFYIRERTKEPDWINEAEKNFFTIQTFGRFPNRNSILGRETTPAETAFLDNQQHNPRMMRA